MNHLIKTIGIVGGVGPQAGIDLHSKIIRFTNAAKDQEHLPIIHMAMPAQITDRSQYLLEPENHLNPGESVYKIIERLYHSGAQIIGIPCNTCHSEPIFSLIKTKIRENLHSEIQLLHMIHEVCQAMQSFQKIGLLATWGTYSSKLYWNIFQKQGIDLLHPASEEQCKRVHQAIYDPIRGLKATSALYDTEFPRAILLEVAQELIDAGAQAIIMGCTEIPLVLEQSDLKTVPLIDATAVLAQALIAHATNSTVLPHISY